MDFWKEVTVDFLGNVLAGLLLLGGYMAVQWFLAATDIVISYAWRFDGTMDHPSNVRPAFDIRNRSRSKTYYLATIAYLKDKRPAASFDNKALWGSELKPGTITFVEAAPAKWAGALSGIEGLNVHIWLQNGRMFWLRGTGPGALRLGRLQRAAFWLRKKIERGAVPTE